MDIEKVGKAIAYLRRRAGYTQKELAERIGISDKAVSKWERGLSLPDIAILSRLSILLDIDTESLLAGSVVQHEEKWGGILKIEDNPYGIYAGTLIYDKPLVYFLLGSFMLAGIRNIRIVCSAHSRKFIERELGDGERIGIKISFGEENLELSNYGVMFGCNIFYGIDQTRLFQRAMAHTDRITTLSLPRVICNGNNGLNIDSNRKIIGEDGEDKVETQYNNCDIPVFFCSAEKLKSIGGIDCLNDVRDIESVYTEIAPRGFVVFPINTWEDVVNASSFVKVVQNTSGMEIYSLEEIAWRRGMITRERLKEIGLHEDNPHGEYLLSLI